MISVVVFLGGLALIVGVLYWATRHSPLKIETSSSVAAPLSTDLLRQVEAQLRTEAPSSVAAPLSTDLLRQAEAQLRTEAPSNVVAVPPADLLRQAQAELRRVEQKKAALDELSQLIVEGVITPRQEAGGGLIAATPADALFIGFPYFRKGIAPFWMGPTLESFVWTTAIWGIIQEMLGNEAIPNDVRAAEFMMRDEGRLKDTSAFDHVRSFVDLEQGLFKHSLGAWPTHWAQDKGVRAVEALYGIQHEGGRVSENVRWQRLAALEEFCDVKLAENILKFGNRCRRNYRLRKGRPEMAICFREAVNAEPPGIPTSTIVLELITKLKGRADEKLLQGVHNDLLQARKTGTHGDTAWVAYTGSPQGETPTIVSHRHGIACYQATAIDSPGLRSGPIAEENDLDGVVNFIQLCARPGGFVNAPGGLAPQLSPTRHGLNILARCTQSKQVAVQVAAFVRFSELRTLIERSVCLSEQGGMTLGAGAVPSLVALWEATMILRLSRDLYTDEFSQAKDWVTTTACHILRSLDYYLTGGWSRLSIYGF